MLGENTVCTWHTKQYGVAHATQRCKPAHSVRSGEADLQSLAAISSHSHLQAGAADSFQNFTLHEVLGVIPSHHDVETHELQRNQFEASQLKCQYYQCAQQRNITEAIEAEEHLSEHPRICFFHQLPLGLLWHRSESCSGGSEHSDVCGH